MKPMVNALFNSEVMKAGIKVVKGTSAALTTSFFCAICMNIVMSSSRVCIVMKLRTGASAKAKAFSNGMLPFI